MINFTDFKNILKRSAPMIDKDSYLDKLKILLQERYAYLQRCEVASPELIQYLEGYLSAARTLDAVSYDEIKAVMDKAHYEVFGKTVEERQLAELYAPVPQGDPDDLELPTWIRWGVRLDRL